MTTDTLLPPRPGDEADGQRWLSAMSRAQAAQRLPAWLAMWRGLLAHELDDASRWRALQQWWALTIADVDADARHLVEPPFPLPPDRWASVRRKVHMLEAIRLLATRCIASHQDALALALDAQARLLRLCLLSRTWVSAGDWRELVRLARLLIARKRLDDPLRFGLTEPPLPRQMLVWPLLLAAAEPALQSAAALGMIDELAGRLGGRVGLDIDVTAEPAPNAVGPTLALWGAGFVRLDTQQLARQISDRRVLLQGRSVAGESTPLPAGLDLAASLAVLDHLRDAWCTPSIDQTIPVGPMAIRPLETATPTTLRLRAGAPVSTPIRDDDPAGTPALPDLHRVAPRSLEAAAARTQRDAKGMGRAPDAPPVDLSAPLPAPSLSGSGYSWGVDRSMRGDLVIGELVGKPSGQQGDERQNTAAPRTIHEVLQSAARERVIERLKVFLKDADPCAAYELGAATGDERWLIERRAAGPIALGGLAILSASGDPTQPLRAGSIEAVAHRVAEPRSADSPDEAPTQCLRMSVWPGDVLLAALRPDGQPLFEDTWYMPASDQRPPSVIVGRGRVRSGETAVLRLAEHGEHAVQFGAVLAQGRDYARLALVKPGAKP